MAQTEEALASQPPPQDTSERRRPKGRRACDAHLKEIALSLRRFLAYANSHPMHRFAEGTQKFLIEVRPIVEQLDTLECERK
jgi:hypothetical protein